MTSALVVPSRTWLGLTMVGLAICASLLVLPLDSWLWVGVARGTEVVVVTILAVAAARMPKRTRIVWWLMWGYAALTASADIVYDVQQRLLDEPPFPGPADALYLASYVSAIIGLFLLVRRVIPGRDTDAWIDTVIITIAVTAVVWYFVARPIVEDTEQQTLGVLIALAYPFLDIAILASLMRLVVGGGRTTVAVTLLIAAFLLTLTADLTYNIVISSGADDFSPPWLDAVFLAAIVLLASASWAPGARIVDQAAQSRAAPASSVRLIGLAVGVLTIPVLLVFVAWGPANLSVRALTLASVGVILLVVVRLQRVLTTVGLQNELLDREARTDSLTGLPNRRTLDYEVERAVETAMQSGAPLTVAMLDLDHFKAFNDEYGHPAGDRLLATCARAWRRVLPASAFLGRYGGEEFAVLLPGAEGRAAHEILEQLRSAMPPGRTVSIGYATRDDRESGPAALRRADSALYEAKSRGRDCIVAAW